MYLRVRLISAALLLGLAHPVLAEEYYWIKATNLDCMVWSDEAMEPNEKVTWSGACANAKVDGRGKLTWTKKGKPFGTYEGVMKAGKFNGIGTIKVVVDGGTNELTGTFKDGDLIGAGVFKDATGGVYEGELENGKPHGHGYMKQGDEEYVGSFENGLRHGYGLSLGPQTAYLGEFDKDVATGSGILEDEVGGRYHGQFKGNKPDGFGTYVASDGAIYQGRFVDGEADGKMMVWSSSSATPVVETWKNGKKVSQ
jgi:hypothetical protein